MSLFFVDASLTAPGDSPVSTELKKQCLAILPHLCVMAVLTQAELPPLQKMVKPALLTFSRSKQIGNSGIAVNETFHHVKIEAEKLKSYKAFFGFGQDIPLCSLYLFAQRAQAHLMLQKTYGLPIPGTIHLQNSLHQLQEIDAAKPFTIKASGTVAYKQEGSLLPTFKVDFMQNDEMVASCESLYLVKRKNKRKGTESREKPVPKLTSHEKLEQWKLEAHTGISYADVSDDHNPIHKSKTMARMAGLKHPIAQGWYMISRAVQAIESNSNTSFRHVINHFHKPHFLPGESALYASGNNSDSAFEIQQNGQLLVGGQLQS